MKTTELVTMKYWNRGSYCLVPVLLTFEPVAADTLASGVTGELAVDMLDKFAVCVIEKFTVEMTGGLATSAADELVVCVINKLGNGVADNPAVRLTGEIE